MPAAWPLELAAFERPNQWLFVGVGARAASLLLARVTGIKPGCRR